MTARTPGWCASSAGRHRRAGPVEAARLAGEIGGGAKGSGIAAAAKLADVVILAVYYQKMDEVIRAAGDLTGKILVDISNPVTEDFEGLLIGHTISAADHAVLSRESKKVK